MPPSTAPWRRSRALCLVRTRTPRFCGTRCLTRRMLCAHAEDEFYRLHEAFLAKHCHHFEDCEENKHVYMDVFRSYVRAPLRTPPTRNAHALSLLAQTDVVEKYIESRLLQRVPGFTMAAFQLSLQ